MRQAKLKDRDAVCCVICGKHDIYSAPLIKDGKVVRYENIGTSRKMLCSDCAIGPDGHAARCRACCPTGHGTHAALEVES